MQYDLVLLFRLMGTMVDTFYEYRFIFLDFVQIMRNNEKVKKHYEQLSLFRKEQFSEAVQHLINTELMRKEELPHEYDFLYDRFQVLVDFWISSAEIKEEGVGKEHVERYKKAISQSIFPYLTAKGKEVFMSTAEI